MLCAVEGGLCSAVRGACDGESAKRFAGTDTGGENGAQNALPGERRRQAISAQAA